MAEIHPKIAAELRRLQKKLDNQSSQISILNTALDAEKRQRVELEKKAVHIDDMPGKQLPFKFQINIPLPAGSASPATGTVTVSRDGPFVARRLYASCIITDAPSLDLSGTTYDFTPFNNRFIPISSRSNYYMWAYSNMNTPISNRIFIPPILDFEWEYNDGGSERNRQDKAISGDILARHDDDGYFMNNEIFSAGTTISFRVSPLRATQIVLESGITTVTGNVALLFKVTFDGFKVLQPLEL